MNSKERAKIASLHQEPDRVPMHLNATRWVVAKLKKALGVSTDRELLNAMNIDFYDLRGIDLHTGIVPGYIGPESEFFPPGWGGAINSFWGVREHENKTISGWTTDFAPAPLADVNDPREVSEYKWPENGWFDFSGIRSKIEEWQDFSIIATGGSVFQHITYVRGTDKLMIDMMMDPDIANFLFDKVFNFYYEYYRRMFDQAGDLIDIFALADDFGMQNTILISPGLFEEYVVPRLKKMIDLAHSNNMKFLLHTCGNVEVLIPRLIELGVDILDPVQPECMNPLHIKQKYGREICLRGGISAQNILPNGTIEQVRNECKRIIEGMKSGGGYIFAPGHPVLQDDVPVENIITMYRSGFEYGKY